MQQGYIPCAKVIAKELSQILKLLPGAINLREVRQDYRLEHCQKPATTPASPPIVRAPAQPPTSPPGASPRISCYLSPITRRRSDMSTWPNLTTTSPVSLFPLAARTVFCARCRNTQQEEDDKKSLSLSGNISK